MQRWILRAGLVLVLFLIGGLLAYALGIIPGGSDDPVEISPEAAASAEAKLERVMEGEEVRLNSIELTSLFRYRPEVWSLAPLSSPVVEMEGDTLRLNGRLPADAIPPQVELGPIGALLPDTLRVDVTGSVRSRAAGEIVLEIGSVEVERMPIPERFYGQVLRSDVLALPLPPGITSARVEAGELVLTP